MTGSGLEVTDMIRSAYEKSLINNAANEAHRRRGFTPKMFLSENFGECCDAITNMARDTLENMARNLDAHQIVSSYRIQGERSEIEAILKSKPEFRLDDALRKEDDHPTTVRYVWQRVGESKKIEKEMPDMFRHEEGDMAVGILGTVKLFSDQFVLETISKQKHKFAKKMVKKYWGKRLVLEKEATVDLAKHAIKSAREGWDKRVNGEEVERPPRQSSVPPEVEAEILRTTMTEHYQKFIDMTVPLLDGMTPREASKVPKMHPKLVELMKIHLHGLHKMRVEKSLEIDVDWLLDELGLEELK